MLEKKLTDKTKLNVKWKINPLDYSHEKEENIIAKIVNKYGIPKENIKIEPQFVKKHDEEDITYGDEVISNINDPLFQQNLFKKYIEQKEIKECDLKKINEIDGIINSKIDYEKYDKNKRYLIKWVKWSNFMSYGENNFIDFTNYKGLVLLTSNPANQGGKTTFCVDLIRFLLFGKVTSRENDWVLSKLFNKHLPEATEVFVEGCICVDGVDYIIKRIVTRPALSKRTERSKVSQKIEYYRLANNEYISLVDDINQEEASTTLTNKAIKEAIGNERDFDLMISVTSDNLKDLISLKDTDRGRLLTRWVGLLPLEEKDKIAREYFNKQVSPSLLLNRYNKEELKGEKGVKKEENDSLLKDIEKLHIKEKEIGEKIEEYKKNKEVLLISRHNIDETLVKIDVKTIERRIDDITNRGLIKNKEKSEKEAYLKTISEVTYNDKEYKFLVNQEKTLSIDINTININLINIKKEINVLEKSEYCVTCGAKLKNVDNSEKIKVKKSELSDLENNLKEKEKQLKETTYKREGLEKNREIYNEKLRLELLIDKISVDIDNLRKDYKENKRIINEINNNKAFIEQNNKIDASIRVINANIETEEKILKNIVKNINENEKVIEFNAKRIKEIDKLIQTIIDEEIILRNWQIYLDMIGKNGVSKMVLRDALPLINGELKNLLSDVCDFNVEVGIDDHQDVTFNLIHDGVYSNLSSGSGFEQTVASLALRSVLCKISSFSKPSFVVFDEILGGISDENYDSVKKLYDKIVKDYKLILQISHIKNIADWHDSSIQITKKNNISMISAF